MEMILGRFKLVPLLLAVFLVCVAAATYAAEQAYLGVVLQPLTTDLKEAMDIKRDLRGVLISDIVDESPADQYGLEDGDIIIEIDGKEIATVKGAVSSIKSYSPGDEVKIVVLREGDKKKVFSVKLGERGEKEREYESFHFESLPDIAKHFEGLRKEPRGYLGVRIENISTSDLGDYFGVDEGEGVLVVEVVDDSPAEEAGLKAGDVILKLDGKEITSTDKLVKYVRKSEPGDKVEITYKRKRSDKTVEVELGETESTTSFFIKGLDTPRKFHMENFDLPDIEKMKDKIRVYHHGDDEDEGWIKVYKYGDDDEDVIELFDMERETFEEEMGKLEEEMKELKKEMQELKKELQGLSGQ